MRHLGRAWFLFLAAAFSAGCAGDRLKEEFVSPPFLYGARPLWFWNGALDVEKTRAMMEQCSECGYSGFGILPARGMSPAFMTPEFLAQYRAAVDGAADLGMKMCLYDEYWFPSGSAGGLLAKQYPEALSKRLDMRVEGVDGPADVDLPLPQGKLMAAVAMHEETKDRVDLAGCVDGGRIAWEVPPGPWKIMLFTCVTDGARGLVDYLDPGAVDKFIDLTYNAYFEAFPERFGSTIDSAFYDEPTFHWVEGGRAWTGAFNEKFEKRYGFHPATLYPALWFDIGRDTAAARNALLGFRAELYASGFPKTASEWCRGHGIRLTGHVDQEEIVNPVGLCGDLIKAFEHQDIPAVDQIFFYGRASKAYKVISSAAYNHDRRLVLTECYGAVKEMPTENLYKEAMDQFAKGINVMVPHAVWYDDGNVIYPPELSPRSPVYGPELSAYNTYVARLQRVLQQGRHVADIGVLYPIATLQAGYRFGEGKPYAGGVIPPEADYMDVGERLSIEVRRDFTFIHPEVLDRKCRVEGSTLELANAVNRETYRVFIIPGSTTVALGNLEKIKAFFDNGGRVIATTMLPSRSAEFGKDGEVAKLVEHIFGVEAARAGASIVAHEPGEEQGESIAPRAPRWFAHSNDGGGKAWFVPSPDAATLKQVLDEALPVCDVAFESDPAIRGGNLSYIHKVVEDRDIYFLANSSDTPIETCVRLRGNMKPEIWDPHSGGIRTAEYRHEIHTGVEVTRLPLVLPPVRSLFVVSPAR